MRWLLLKDLQILRRSPVLVALLVLYPVIIATLIGFALSRGPDKPEVAFVNLVPRSANEISLGGERIDLSEQAGPLFDAIDPVRVDTREEAIQMVEDGDVLAAIVIPKDTTEKLQSGLEPAEVEVYYNADDPVKADFVRDTIKSQVQDANTALTKRLSQVAIEFLNLIAAGGEYNFLGRDFDVLGLERSEEILREARADLPPGSEARMQIDQVIAFASLARENLDLSDDVLSSVSSPLRVKQTELDGGATPLSSFAVALAVSVSLMFITLLLAAGALALEREDNAFGRLVRGLVSKTGLLAEKAGLAAVCSLVVCLLMLAGLGLFVDLAWDRFPAVGRGGGRRGAGVRGARARGGRAHQGGARGVAAVRDALAAARVPRAGAVGLGVPGALRRGARDLRPVPLQAHAGRAGRGAERHGLDRNAAAASRRPVPGLRPCKPAGAQALCLTPDT